MSNFRKRTTITMKFVSAALDAIAGRMCGLDADSRMQRL